MYIISIESKIAFLEGLGVNASSPCGVCVCVCRSVFPSAPAAFNLSLAQPEAYRCFWASSRSEAAHGEPFEEHKHIYIPPARGDAKLGSLQGKRTYLVSLLLNAPGVFAQKSSSLLIVLHMLIWYSTPYTQTLHGTGILVDQSGPMECLGY